MESILLSIILEKSPILACVDIFLFLLKTSTLLVSSFILDQAFTFFNNLGLSILGSSENPKFLPDALVSSID